MTSYSNTKSLTQYTEWILVSTGYHTVILKHTLHWILSTGTLYNNKIKCTNMAHDTPNGCLYKWVCVR